MSGKPVLIVINGAPGTGKTTLSKKLSDDLKLPCLRKDDVKELLFDKMGTGDLEWSQDLGAGVAEMLFAFIERWLARGRSLIAESAYYFKFANPRFVSVVNSNDIIFLEIYCKTDPDVRRQRFINRNENGERHSGHVDHNFYSGSHLDNGIDAKYAPLKVGKVFEVDTTEFGPEQHRSLLKDLQVFIDKGVLYDQEQDKSS